MVGRSKPTSELTSSIVPRGTSFHRWVELEFLLCRWSAGPSRHPNSPHPSSREGHHSTAGWSSSSFFADGRQVQADIRTHLIHRPARDIIPPLGGARVPSIGSCCCRGLVPGPAELGAVNPDA